MLRRSDRGFFDLPRHVDGEFCELFRIARMVNHLSRSGVLIENALWRTAVLVRGADCESFELLRCARLEVCEFSSKVMEHLLDLMGCT